MRNTEEKDIDGHRIMVTQFPGREALKIWSKLVAIAGPGLGTALGALKGGKGVLDAEVDTGALGLAVKDLTSRLADEQEVERLVIRLLAQTRRDGQEITEKSFDLMFMGGMLHLMKVLGFVLQVNYSDFFGAVSARLEKPQADPAAGN